MVTATAPAAVPDPNEQPNSAPSGLLASAFAAVDPARSAAFDIPASTTPDGATDTTVAGGSSATYHGSNEIDGTGAAKNSDTAEKKSIWRAWLLAGAARWAKGGGAHNKRLEVAKMRAQARQVKENRQVTLNRSDGIPGKGTNSPVSGGGKNLSNKAKTEGPTKSPKHSNGNTHHQPKGNSGNNGAPGSAGRSGGRGTDSSGTSGRTSNGGSTNPKNASTGSTTAPTKRQDTPPTQTPKDRHKGFSGNQKSPTGPQAGGAKNGALGPAGSPGKPGPSTGGGSTRPTGNDRPPKNTSDPSKNPGNDRKISLDKPRKHKGSDQAPAKDTNNKQKKPSKDQPTTDNSKTSKDKTQPGDTSTGKTPKTTKEHQTKPPKTHQNTAPTRTPLQESRETGYRDGARAAKAATHVKAYRDGVKDGWTDTTTAAKREKARLDEAHDVCNKAREAAQDKEHHVSAAGTSADHHQNQPIEVKAIDSKNLWLGEGADKNVLTRGEVRSLKTFERRLETKATSMKKAAEDTKSLKAHAEAQAQKVTALMETAKSVKGGDKLIASLVKTTDDAKVQASLAEEIHKRAIRAADGCAAVLANTQVRYGAMYKAVVDSDETAPAEMRFYLEGTTSHG